MKNRFNKEDFLDLLNQLDITLGYYGVKTTLSIYGGASLMLAYDLRVSTVDIDAVYGEKSIVNKAIKDVSEQNNISESWINDGVKGFLSNNESFLKSEFKFKNIEIQFATAEYLLAMKLVSFRNTDIEDIRNLIELVKLGTYEETMILLQKYYPLKALKQSTLYFLDEYFSYKQNWI